jgi:mannose-6-phosphate isomerase
MGKGDPKTECWYIISAEPGAVLYKGVKRGVTREAFAEAIREGTVGELLTKVPVAAGQCHFLPAGTAHTLGEGLLIAEIQTPSDTTYRVFDWNRVDDSGKPRALHIAEALESINFDVSGDELGVTTMGRLVDCEYFKIDKGHQAEDCELLLSAGQMKTLIVVKGAGRIVAGGGTVDFKAGDCVLVPAEYEGAMQFLEDTEYLTVTI